MKNAHAIPLLLGSILLAASLLAQSSNSAATNPLPESDPVALARSRYSQSENDLSVANNYGADQGDKKASTTLAQASRPRIGRPYGPPMRPGMGSYPRMRPEPGSGLHVLVGAGIGFGIGAGLGAASGGGNKIGIAGLFGAFFGGVIGACINSAPGFHRYRPWEDEEYDELGAANKRQGSTHRKPSSQAGRSEATARRQVALAERLVVP